MFVVVEHYPDYIRDGIYRNREKYGLSGDIHVVASVFTTIDAANKWIADAIKHNGSTEDIYSVMKLGEFDADFDSHPIRKVFGI